MIFTKFTPQIARSDANPVKEMCHGLTVLVPTILMFLLDSQSGWCGKMDAIPCFSCEKW